MNILICVLLHLSVVYLYGCFQEQICWIKRCAFFSAYKGNAQTVFPKLCTTLYSHQQYVRVFCVLYSHVFSLYLLKRCGIGNTVSILQMGKLRARGVNLPEFHIASEQQSWVLNLDLTQDIQFYLLLFQDIIWKTGIAHKGPQRLNIFSLCL